jgi:hypothetical protein
LGAIATASCLAISALLYRCSNASRCVEVTEKI